MDSRGISSGDEQTSTPSSAAAASKWVQRWGYEMAATASHRGIWKLRGGGFYIRVRVTDPRTRKPREHSRALREEGLTLRDAIREQRLLREVGRERNDRTTRSIPLFCDYAVSLFEQKVADGSIKSAKTRERWELALRRILPALGRAHVDELRAADLLAWREEVTSWLRDGAPSIRKGEEGKRVHLAPVTANGWISILKVICGAMTKHYELLRNPSDPVAYFRQERVYTYEQPNAVETEKLAAFLATVKRLYPQHYAMVFLGFITGLRPSHLRPIRRQGANVDVLWEEKRLLIRRSNTVRQEIMDLTKTRRDQMFPLPDAVIGILKEHVAALPEGPMRESVYLFPSTKGGMRTHSVLDKPFRHVLEELGWVTRVTPRAMRRTFNDFARDANIRDVVIRAISGHQTEAMQLRYSTAQMREMAYALDLMVANTQAKANDTQGAEAGAGASSQEP